MMLQEIIVYIILAFSFGITIYKIVGFFNIFGQKSKASACSSCSSGACGGCRLQNTVKQNRIVLPLKIDAENLK